MTEEQFNDIYNQFQASGKADEYVFVMTHKELNDWDFELIDGKWVDTQKEEA